MSASQLRVLCLHGYRQDSSAMKTKMGGMRKAFKRVQFVYVDAPNHIPGTNESDTPKQLSWFNNLPEGFKYDATGDPVGFEKSCKVLDDTITDEGPFDVILGFSQGASMVGLYLAHCSLKGLNPFKAAIFFSGFTSKVVALQSLATQNLTIPSLHIYSKNDTVIPDSASIDFMKLFEKSTDLIHEGGHGFPSLSIMKPTLNDFFEKVSGS